MRFSSGTSRWWVAAYLAVTLVCTTGWLILSQRLAEQTGLSRQVWLANDFQGIPVINDVAREPTLDFLDDDPRLPREFISARWRGYWYVPSSRSFTLHVEADDYADIWIDGEQRFARSSAAERALQLDAGVHELQIAYQQYAGAANLAFTGGSGDAYPLPLRTGYLFPDQPEPNLLRLVGIVDLLTLTVGILWAAGALAAAGALTAAVFILWRRRYHTRWTEVAFACVVGLISLSAVIARLPGWNPESLWDDDVIFGSLIRSSDLYSLITTPIHHAPGLFLVWRGFYEISPDPEWSLQILPFACGIAAIPVMALLGRRLTGDAALGVLAGALTALNPLLAYYTVVVHEYSFEFLLTALFLLGAVAVGGRVLRGIDPGRFAWLALGGGVAAFFSAASLLVSFPILHLGALFAIASDRRLEHYGTLKVLLWSAGYDIMAVAAVLFMQRRVNAAVTEDFAGGFTPLHSPNAAMEFLASAGRRVVEMSMPNWTGQAVPHFGLPAVSWPLPLMAVGLIWLLARRQCRFVGLALGGIYSAVVVASGLELYPLGAGRTDIFTFPVGILLFTAGVWCVTDVLRRRSAIRLLAAMTAVALVISRPVPVTYRDRNDARLVEHLAGNVQSEDWIMLSFSAGYLAAFYGPWDVDLIPHHSSTGFVATIVHDKVLHLPLRLDYGSPDGGREQLADREHRRVVRNFLEGQRPARIWLLAWHASTFDGRDWVPNILSVLVDDGYRVEMVQDATRGALYLAVNP